MSMNANLYDRKKKEKKKMIGILQNTASFSTPFLLEGSECCVIKNSTYALSRLSRTLEVGPCLHLVCHRFPFFIADYRLFISGKLLFGRRVAPQINFCGNEEKRDVWAEMLDFWHPLCLDVFETVTTFNRETHQNDVSVWVG